MRCPRCSADYEDHVQRCADCRVALVPAELAEHTPVVADADAHLGTFHPAVAERITALLGHRRIVHATEPHDDGVRIRIDRFWRDDIRAELTLTWDEVVRGVPEETVAEVLATGGPAPGWFDAPRGGYVDREGRLVVEADPLEEAEEDAARVVGPLLLTVGAILTVVGWYVLDSTAILLIGVGLVAVGLFTPR